MQHQISDSGHERVATFDIETTHFDASKGETISIGIGVHERGQPVDNAKYIMMHRKPALKEADLIREAFQELDSLDADALVSYNGTGFDFEFLNNRLKLLGEDIPTANVGDHIDLYVPRKQKADAAGKKWPSLEECLHSYGHQPATTIWQGEPITNTRFGEKLGPALLKTIETDDQTQWEALIDVVEHYLLTDFEANLAVYHGDIGAEFEPCHLGSRKEFSVKQN